MMVILKNYWKLFEGLGIRSEAKKQPLGISSFPHDNIELRFFFLFFCTLLVTYIFAGLITNSELQSLGYSHTLNSSPISSLKLLWLHVLIYFRGIDIITQVYMLSFFACAAYGLTKIVMKPIQFSNAQRTYFAINAGHELNTPLSILKTISEVARMRKDKLTPMQVTELTNSIEEEVDRMSKIVTYFLHGAKADKKFQLPMNDVSIARVVKNAAKNLYPLADEHHVILEILGKKSGVIIWGNFSALSELVYQLAKNAITYSPPGGIVKLSYENLHDHVLLTVSDEGGGIHPEDLPHIFDPLYKGKNAIRGGSGLGLTIVQETTQQHLTRVTVSQNSGRGSVFSVKFYR